MASFFFVHTFSFATQRILFLIFFSYWQNHGMRAIRIILIFFLSKAAKNMTTTTTTMTTTPILIYV